MSVIIRTYNQPALLKEAVESALAQTLRPSEVIVVDDASTDETPDVMAAYVGRAPVRYVRLEENRGMLRTGQIGFEKSEGEFIAFLDHDDLWLPRHLELCVAALQGRPGAALAFGRYGLIDLHGRTLVQEVAEARLGGSPLKTLLFKKVIATPSRSVYSRRALAELGGIRPVLWDWAYPVLLAAADPGGVVQLPERTALMRLHGTQSYSRPEALLDSLLGSTEYIFENLPPSLGRLKGRVVALNLLHAGVFYWQAGKNRGAWRCLARAVGADPTCVSTKDFRAALLRLLAPAGAGRVAREWKRRLQRRRNEVGTAAPPRPGASRR